MHCRKCGAKLIVTDKGKVRYSQKDGEKEIHTRLLCPRKRHLLDGHDSYKGIYFPERDTFDADIGYTF